MLGDMIEIKLNTAHFSELLKKGYDLNMIFLLKLLEETDEAYPTGAKIDSIIQTMQRKGLINELEIVTDEGRKLLGFLLSTENTPKIPRKKIIKVEDDFDKWWKAYPPTNTFTYNGRTFSGTRALRISKDACKKKIHEILAKEEYSIDDLINALKLEVHQKVESSYKTGQNKMNYMQNSLTYLNQCTYEPFIELVKAGHKVVESKQSSGGVEI